MRQSVAVTFDDGRRPGRALGEALNQGAVAGSRTIKQHERGRAPVEDGAPLR